MTTGNAIETPLPFLDRLFQPGVEPEIEAGFYYSADAVAMLGVGMHRAIDFGLPRGTEVLVPADGWAVATYGEVQLTHGGKPRLISLEQALKSNRPEGIQPPEGSGPWPGYYGSYVVQIWHGRGRYTQYAHLDWTDPRIPYFGPVVQENGDLIHNPVLRATVDDYRKAAVRLKRGEVLGVVGMTGCGWGSRCYETAAFGKDGRPDFRQAAYTHWDQPHLHFMAFGQRRGKKRVPAVFWDPFGVYSDKPADYPTQTAGWPGAKNSLWLP